MRIRDINFFSPVGLILWTFCSREFVRQQDRFNSISHGRTSCKTADRTKSVYFGVLRFFTIIKRVMSSSNRGELVAQGEARSGSPDRAELFQGVLRIHGSKASSTVRRVVRRRRNLRHSFE